MENIDKQVKELKQKIGSNKRIVFVSGNFNVIHPGHLRLLQFASDCGDFLVIGVNDRDSTGAIIPEDMRLRGVKAISIVDYAFLLQNPPELIIEKLQPEIVVKGKEYENRNNPEYRAVNKYGGKLLFSSGDIVFSSLDLLRKEFQYLNFSTINLPDDYPHRHGIKMQELLDVLEKMKKLKVCVIGDTIVDEYITCEALGMSQEEPSIVVSPVTSEKFIGGAAIVAAHARGLGADVNYFSVVGRDETAKYVSEKLQEYQIKYYTYEDDSRPTSHKLRYRAENKTLLKVSHLRNQDISAEIRDRLLEDLKKVLEDMDLLIFSDFNYGLLPQELVDDIIFFCKKKNITMVADSQSSSQVGNISRFKGMRLVTPTEREARIAVRDFNSGLVILAEELGNQSLSENIILTLGAEGILIYAPAAGDNYLNTDRLPSFNTAPKDVTGAGDSLLTCTSMALCCGCDIWQSAYLGSLAAACQVGRIGNTPLRTEDLKVELSSIETP